MSLHDPRALREGQYKDSSNLNARGALHARFSTNPYGWFRWVHDHLDLPQRGRVLELGCGPGTLWARHLERVPSGSRVILSDNSAGMVREVKERLGGASPFWFAVLDAQAIPFVTGALDAVIANHMLYHLPELSRSLSEIQRVLRAGGLLYAATNGPLHLKELVDLIEAFDPSLLSVWGQSRRTFDLENGTERLGRWFVDVRRYRYEDGLVVDEAEPLTAYVASWMMASLDARRESFLRFVETRLAESGPLRITKDAGLFVARRA